MKTAIIAGCRTPFARSGSVFADLTAIELGKIAVRDALGRSGLKGERVDQLIYGTVVHDTQAPNIAPRRPSPRGAAPTSLPASCRRESVLPPRAPSSPREGAATVWNVERESLPPRRYL